MSSYENFSEVYDTFMADTPYPQWVQYIQDIWHKYNVNPKLVAELGCGTGNITEIFSTKGYDMIGIDISESMLSKAKQKAAEQNKNILYLNQDMREFELYGTVDSIICLCDSINYLTEEEDLFKVFKLVNNYLEPGGFFIFDLNTIYKFQHILSDNSFSETTETSAYTWENYYDSEKCINEYYTNFFILDPATGKYDRYEEYHYERGYTIKTISELISKAGLELLSVYDEFTFNPPHEDSQRIYFVAKEITKRR